MGEFVGELVISLCFPHSKTGQNFNEIPLHSRQKPSTCGGAFPANSNQIILVLD
jgi:hypothetical protein